MGRPSIRRSSLPGNREAVPPASSTMAMLSMTARVLLGEVGDYDIRTGAHEASQELVDRGRSVEPAVRDRGLQHCIFAAYVVDGERNVEAIPRRAYDVEVGKAGFDHHDVGALRDIERDF